MSNKKKPMNSNAAARIQSDTAKKNEGQVPKASFSSRAQRAAAKNFPQAKAVSNKNPNYPSKTGEPSGTGRGNTPKR